MSDGMGVGRARAALDVAVQVAGRALNLIPGVVVTLLARTLGDDSFGQWSTALAVVQIGATVGDFGLEQVAVGEAAAERGRARVDRRPAHAPSDDRRSGHPRSRAGAAAAATAPP